MRLNIVQNGARRALAGLLAFGVMLGTACGIVPEPDKILFGTITVNGRAVTSTNTDYVVDVRLASTGAVLQTYQMGADPEFDPYFYGIRVPLEAFAPLASADCALGDALTLVLRRGSTVLMQLAHTVSARGPSRIDFGPAADTDGDGLSDLDERDLYGTDPNNPDTDGDGMPDGWEVAHNLNPLVNDADQDADGDGHSNLDEYLGRRDPWDPNNVPLAVKNDVDGDRTSDLLLYHAQAGTWYMMQSTNGFRTAAFGDNEFQIPCPADYDGDGKVDMALYLAGVWHILQSSNGYSTVEFGWHGAVPVPHDYDGDGRADLALYYQPWGRWYIRQSTAGFRDQQFGWELAAPVPGDYDGDGHADLAVYGPGGMWYVLRSQYGFTSYHFGWDEPVPVPADYDGDGRTDLGLYHGPSGTWFLMMSHDGFLLRQFGWDGPLPVPADYDGDGRTDLALYYPPTGTWYILQSTAGFRIRQFGWDEPIPCGAAGR
ncbi:MAG: VCBS repeat-containing protein [Kiritimatiellae bacterium]|nr:VCBS repeat-containing protein [Kiritimatiellia bacterium]